MYNVYITSFKPLLRRGEEKSIYVTVKSKEETSQDFCPIYVQEFGHWLLKFCLVDFAKV